MVQFDDMWLVEAVVVSIVAAALPCTQLTTSVQLNQFVSRGSGLVSEPMMFVSHCST